MLIYTVYLCVNLFGEIVGREGTVLVTICFSVRPFLTCFFVRVRGCWGTGVLMRRCDFTLPGRFLSLLAGE